MVPNVYGMSQHADGGLITTKPYISGSSYILRMSNFRKGPWCPIWDALYWRFIDRTASFSGDPRMSHVAGDRGDLGRAHPLAALLERLHGEEPTVHTTESSF